MIFPHLRMIFHELNIVTAYIQFPTNYFYRRDVTNVVWVKVNEREYSEMKIK